MHAVFVLMKNLCKIFCMILHIDCSIRVFGALQNFHSRNFDMMLHAKFILCVMLLMTRAEYHNTLFTISQYIIMHCAGLQSKEQRSDEAGYC